MLFPFQIPVKGEVYTLMGIAQSLCSRSAGKAQRDFEAGIGSLALVSWGTVMVHLYGEFDGFGII